MALGSSKSNELMQHVTLCEVRVGMNVLDKRTAKRLKQANAVPISDVLTRLGYQVRTDGGHREQQFSCDLHGDSRDKMPSGRMYPETNSTYCVDYTTEILTQRGWLKGNEVQTTDLTLVYKDGVSQWEPVLAVVEFPAAPRRMLSMETKTHSSLTTEDHRWYIEKQIMRKGRKSWGGDIVLSKSGFTRGHRIPYGGRCSNLPTERIYSDAFVEIMGWFVTEGHIFKPCGNLLSISQSWTVNRQKCLRIESALTELYGPPVLSLRDVHHMRKGMCPAWRKDKTKDGSEKMTYSLNVKASEQILATAPDRIANYSFVAALTEEQLHLFIETAVDGDGCRIGKWKQLCQKDPRILNPIQMASSLLGKPMHIWERGTGDFAGQFLVSKGFFPAYWGPQAIQWVENCIPVWCVQTPSGTWTARRNGSVYVTGNCFACQKSRRPIDYLKDKKGMKFYEALRALEIQYNLPFIPWEEGDPTNQEETEPTFEMAQESEAVELADRCNRLLSVACKERSLDLDAALRYMEILERTQTALSEGVKPAEALALLTKLKDRLCNTTNSH